MLGFCCSCCRRLLNCSLLTLEAVTNLAVGDLAPPGEDEKLVRGEVSWVQLALFTAGSEDLTSGELPLCCGMGVWWCRMDFEPIASGDDSKVLAAIGTTFVRSVVGVEPLLLVGVVSEK